MDIAESRVRKQRFLAAVWGMLGCLANAHGGVISGTVTGSPDIGPVADAWVYLWGRGVPGDSVLTDSAGAYQFGNVGGCARMDCEIHARKAGFWLYTSPNLIVGADENRVFDVDLELVQSLSLQVTFAGGPATSTAGAYAMLVDEIGNTLARAIDSAGRAEFQDLHSYIGYRLTVSAPGWITTSNALHFHYPTPDNRFRVTLAPDTAGTGKFLEGTLSAKGDGPAARKRILMSCRGATAADLFAETALDGRYSIGSIPADCDSALLLAGEDSLAVGLPAKANHLDWSAEFPGPASAVRPVPAAVRAAGPARRAGWFDLLGRKVSAARARFRL